jgi:hypothetical protein
MAEKYTQPKPVKEKLPAMSTESGKDFMNELNISAGTTSKGNYKPTKTSGIEMRGGKAQTKGKMSRGPMA